MSYWSVVLILITVCLFILPLLPALLELFHPTDMAPLKVVQAYDNNPMYFAEGFQNYIHTHLIQPDGGRTVKRADTLADGTSYQRLEENEQVDFGGKQHTHKLLFSHYSLTLPGEKIFEAEVFSGLRLVTGAGSHFRALMANESLAIGDNSTVWRWAHSDGDVTVGRNAALNGRVTSRKTLTLGIGCRFERLHAAKIVCGTENIEPEFMPQMERTVLAELPDVKTLAGRRSLLEGDLDFPAGHEFDGDIVAGSTALIGDNAYIKGNIKSNALNDLTHYLHSTGAMTDKTKGSARCELGNHVRIDGAVISTHDLIIGQYCRILGPVIAENLLVIRTGTIIGSPLHPSTVTAPEIIIESGCIIYGSLFATKQGMVRTAIGLNEEIAA